MHNLVQAYLDKYNIDPALLTKDEENTLKEWNAIMGKKELSIDDVRDWLLARKLMVELQLGKLDNSEKRQDRLVVWLTLLNQMIKLIDSPSAERKGLEEDLQKKLDGNDNNPI